MILDRSHLCGCRYVPPEAAAFRSAQPIQRYGALPRENGRGKKRFLWTFQRQVMGEDFEEIQTIGDCVSKGVQRVMMLLYCVRIALQGYLERVPGIIASEPIYGLGRHEIGKDQLGSGDGLVVAWGLQAAMEYGALIRRVYGDIDLSAYSGALAKKWGSPRVGVPNILEPLMSPLQIVATAPVGSWDDLCTALYNGEPVVGGSDSIYERRGSDGYLVMTMRGGHCTIFDGYDDTAAKPCVFYNNASWPPMSGERIEDCPRCSGPIIRGDFERMLDEGEWYAVSDEKGMPAQSDDLNRLDPTKMI